MIQVVFPQCAGLDVHKKFVVACRRTVDEHGRTQQQIRKFGTMTDDLLSLADWLAEVGCMQVAMESSGVYWQPIYNILEDRFEVWLVNARHAHNLPGRKTDVKDAEWLAEMMQHGLLKRSFIPPRPQRELRELVRYRQTVTAERSRVANRIQKVLEDANLKLGTVAADIQGVSAQAILHALVQGRQTPGEMAELARGKLRHKQAELERALTGRVRAHHRFMLSELLVHLDFLDERIETLSQEIEQRLEVMPPFQAAISRLDTIPGVSRHTATLIVTEIGVDMSRFATDRHLTAWAGLAPGNNETGGKKRPGKMRKGNRSLRAGLTQAAHAAAHKKGSYLRSLYYRLAARRGKSRAAVAVARTILQIAYHIIARGETYQELGDDYLDRLDRGRTTKRLVHRLEKLGYIVSLTERGTSQAHDATVPPGQELAQAA